LNESVISEDLRRFIRAFVKSVWALDLLLFIRRNAGQTWTAEALTRELRSSRQLVVEILSGFKEAGLVVEHDGGACRYQPSNPELQTHVEALARLYAEKPIALVKEIMSAPNEKIHIFADAFKFRQD
jgi:hypothetical protein